MVLWDSICQVVKQRIEGFDKDDWLTIVNKVVLSLVESANEVKNWLNALNKRVKVLMENPDFM